MQKLYGMQKLKRKPKMQRMHFCDNAKGSKNSKNAKSVEN